MTVRHVFEHDLDELGLLISKIGAAVEKAVSRSLESLNNLDVELAEKVLVDDDIVDNLELEIVEKGMRLLALQQPIAKDLRTVSTCLKIATDFERIGDHAGDIAKVTKHITGTPILKMEEIDLIANSSQVMLRMSLDAYTYQDAELAEKVIAKDDEVDDLFTLIHQKTLQVMKKEPDIIDFAVGLLSVATNLERIADHATNIAEGVIYLKTGKRVP
ncbi:phosphate signaling complex protein PhoU [Bacillota bacterium LX-D]|nr:phosphate signaling complex protein PhoU [Bacillota bacterium LX-D]